MRPPDDAELLTEYATRNSEEAFAMLVERHVALVYSAALRQVRDPQQAEDVTQAVFILLARKARAMGRHKALSGWLCRVAHFVSRDALRAERRRLYWENISAQMKNTDDTGWTHIAPLLDEAVAQLGEKDRNAIVLRFYERKSLGEVAAVLGVGADAAQKRVSRALEKLRKFYAGRGVSSTATIISGAITAHSVQIPPAALAKSVVGVAITKGAAASGSTLTLIKGASKLMAWTKAKTAIVVGVGIVLAAGTIVETRPLLEGYQKAQMRAEMQQVETKVMARQLVDETQGATLIDLKPYINTKLTDSPSSPKGITADNLAGLHKGTNIYAGVPFDVEGTIQLMGNSFRKYGKDYPVKVENIPIGRTCTKLHLFHGESSIPWEQSGMPVAKLILHYATGADEELNLVAGAQAFDFWGPTKKYGLRFKPEIKPAAGTELAWIGTNPWVQKWMPMFKLRLYRTTFANPRPSEVISSIDYVSTLAQDTAPFLAELTVE